MENTKIQRINELARLAKERELTQDEYSQYLIAMEQAKEINEHSDEEAIDNYTRQLMDEGVL